MTTQHAPLPAEKLTALRATTYAVSTPRALPLKVGGTCPELTQLLRKRYVVTAALITAHNPMGQKSVSPAKNKKANAALVARIEEMGFPWLPAVRRGLTTGEEGEAGLFVFGIQGAQAEELMVEFEQTAILWFSAGGTAELMLHPQMRRGMPA
jgi:hypothetical protein